MSSRRSSLPTFKSIIPILTISAVLVFILSQFMLIKVKEDSMTPTLADGQWVFVHRGAGRIQPGDIAVFISPLDHQLVIKRCVLKDEMSPVVDHGWLITPWGEWFLTAKQWDRLDRERPEKDGSFYMVGDNQFRSLDSRNYGYIPTESLIGKVLLRSKHG